jgi:hypothetical protein
MKTVPQIPLHWAEVGSKVYARNYHEQNQPEFNPRLEVLHATGTAIGVQFVVGLIVLMAAGFMVLQ